MGEAADNFDKRHKIAHAEALKQLNLLSGNSIRRCPAETTARSLDLRMEQLRGNRLTVQPLRFLSLSARDKPISPRELARNYNHSPRDKSQNHSLGGSFGGGPGYLHSRGSLAMMRHQRSNQQRSGTHGRCLLLFGEGGQSGAMQEISTTTTK